MKRPDRILLVDDNPDDRALAVRALQKQFPRTRFIEVGTAADFAREIDGEFDCVISDYRIGWTDGLAVLRAVKQRRPDVPVIMFANTGSEEVCSTGMKAGLSDYIVKRRAEFPKLPAAVATALELAEARRLVKERDQQLAVLLEREQFARAEAVRANHLKDEFLATVSHELRTPLSAILGWTHILLLERVTREQEREAFKIIDRNARIQAKLIEDLLDMSRIISGTLRIDLGPLDILDALNKVVEAAQPQADKKHISLEKRFAPAPPIRGDAHRIQQIVSNLVMNAIKFTPDGGKIVVSLLHSGAVVEIAVTDNGIGIDPSFLPHLFGRFTQGETGPSRRHGGLGIGLSVVKSLVEMHGGSVNAYSEGLGKGARFVVEFPVAVTHEQKIAPAAAYAEHHSGQGLKGLSVLAVDDDSDTLAIIQRVLNLYGAQVRTAHNAREAWALLKESAFDIVLSDIGMPEIDGYSFIQAVRKNPGPNQHIPAASVTAFSRSQDREHALASGFNAHLVKPIDPGELLAVILTLARHEPQQQTDCSMGASS